MGNQYDGDVKKICKLGGGVSCFYLVGDNENLHIISSVEVMVDYDKISWPLWQAAPDRDSFFSVFTTYSLERQMTTELLRS